MVLGHEMSLSPMASVMLGKRLNAKSFFSVLKGRELGIDPITSISKIYNIDTKNGSVIALAVDIIIAKILESGTEFEYLRDYEPTPTYKTLDGTYVGHKYLITNDDGTIKDNFFIYITGKHSADDAANAQKKGQIVVLQSGLTNVTSIRFIRKAKNINMVLHYSMQDAIDADLYNGFHSKLLDANGKPVYNKGKFNWNSHPATHLRHRPLSIGGRIIVADVLMGIYSIQEAIEILNKDSVQTEDDLIKHQYEEAEVIGDK